MKKVFLLFMTVATLVSCSKNDDKPANEVSCQIVSLNSGGDSYQLEYDNNGRVIRAKSTMVEGPNDVIRREYKFQYSDKSIIVEAYEDDVLDYKRTLVLANNVIESSNLQSNWGSSSSLNTEYVYNSDNQLLKETSYTPNSSIANVLDFSYTNGNIVSLTAKQVNRLTGATLGGNETFTAKYNVSEKRTPYIELSSFVFVGSSLFGEWFMVDFDDAILYEQGFFGKKGQNEIASASYHNQIFSYGAKDSNNNTTKVSVKNDRNQLETTISLTYNCK